MRAQITALSQQLAFLPSPPAPTAAPPAPPTSRPSSPTPTTKIPENTSPTSSSAPLKPLLLHLSSHSVYSGKPNKNLYGARGLLIRITLIRPIPLKRVERTPRSTRRPLVPHLEGSSSMWINPSTSSSLSPPYVGILTRN